MCDHDNIYVLDACTHKCCIVCVRVAAQTTPDIMSVFKCKECSQSFTMQDLCNVIPSDDMITVTAKILTSAIASPMTARLCRIVDVIKPTQPEQPQTQTQTQPEPEQPQPQPVQPQSVFNTDKEIGRILHYALQHNKIPNIAALIASAQEIAKKSNRCTGCTIKGHMKNNANCPIKHISPAVIQSIKAEMPIVPKPPKPQPSLLVIDASSGVSTIIPIPAMVTPAAPPITKGTGFGGSTSDKHIPAVSSSQGQFDILALGMIRALTVYLNRHTGTSVFEYTVLTHSNFIPDIITLIRNDSITDIHLRKNVYIPLFNLLRIISEDYTANRLLVPDISLAFSNLNTQASVFMNLHASASSSDAEIDSDTMEIMTIVFDISDTYNTIQNNTSHIIVQTTEEGVSPASSEYIHKVREMSFTEADLDVDKHLLHEAIATDSQSSRKKIIRISKELSSMSTSLPLSKESIVIVKVSRARMDVLSFMITGPVDTPYAYGCFVFDMYLNSNYPEKPPMCLIRTTGGGAARFNPNLYSNGKVCMSILGTWQGPGWVPGVSSILQVIISIQSLIMVPEPYFNEPGYESTYGTPSGIARSKSYNEVICEYTVRYAMLQHIRGILAFDANGNDDTYEQVYYDAMRAHYIENRVAIIRNVTKWGCKSATQLICELNRL